MPKAISILFGALFTLATIYSLGRLTLNRLRVELKREELPLFSLTAGAAVLSFVLFCLAAAQLLYDAVLLGVGVAAIAGAWRLGLLRLSGDRLPELPQLWRWLYWILFAVFATVCGIWAMAPEWSPDGSSYHLGVIGHFYRHHGFLRMDSNMYANMPQGFEMLYLFAWAFGRHSAAALVHYAFLITLALMLLRFGQRNALPAAGAAASLFVLACPVVMVDGASAYIDVALAALLFALFYLCEIEAPPLATGLLAGFCFAMKYTAFVALAYLALRYALRLRWRHILWAALPATLMVAPWLVRNYIWFGNPVSPFFNVWWPNPFMHVSFEQDYTLSMRHYEGLSSYWQLPLMLTVKGQVLGGFLGPLFLLSPLALLALRKPLGRRVLAAGVLFAVPYLANVGTRFLIPALPFVSFALAAALPVTLLPVLVLAHGVLSFPDVPAKYCDEFAWRIGFIPLRQALRIESQDSWLNYKWPAYRVARMIENETKPGDVVFSLGAVSDAYTRREVRSSFQSGVNEQLREYLYTAVIPDFQSNQRIEYRFARQKFSAIRVLQTATPKAGTPGERDIWSIGEFHVLDEGRIVPRSDDWRLWAMPNPWDVQKAFDNYELTRWRSWEWVHPGMYVEIRFPQPRTLDGVNLDVSTDQYAAVMALEGRDEAGAWRRIEVKETSYGLAPPLGLRRAAMQELKAAGVTHLLVAEGDYHWDDYEQKADRWGLRKVAQVDVTRLYKLE